MELISKQEIIDRLDNVIENGASDSNGLHPLSAEAVREMVEQLPPAQSQIIRCKDCKYREYYRESDYMCALDTGDPYMTARNAEDDDWFCADAERRQNDTERC